jgi:hypothetical protein
MIDFSAVAAVVIPEGAAKKIRDAAGNIIWQKADDVTMVTVVLGNSIQQSYQGVKVNGTMLTEEGQSASVPLGTLIQMYGYYGVWEGGALVGNHEFPGDYVDYMVKYDIRVEFEGNGIVDVEKIN